MKIKIEDEKDNIHEIEIRDIKGFRYDLGYDGEIYLWLILVSGKEIVISAYTLMEDIVPVLLELAQQKEECTCQCYCSNHKD